MSPACNPARHIHFATPGQSHILTYNIHNTCILAARNSLPAPYPNAAAARAAYNFSDLQSFLDLYYAGEP